MFGVLRGAGCGLGAEGRREWMGQICGVCLALGRHGQVARLATGYDAALLAALVEAQQAAPPPRVGHGCPLRPGFHGAVADPAGPGARYGAAAALLIASARIADDLADGERYARLPGVAALGRAAGRRATGGLAALGIDPAPLVGAAAAQPALEGTAPDVTAAAEPTARACAAAFAHTAALAGSPANAAPLSRAGRAYGRIIYLIDALRDRRADAARGRFNPLHSDTAPLPLFQSWHGELLGALGAAALSRPQLVRGLLDAGLARAWRAAADADRGAHQMGRQAPARREGWCQGWCEGCGGCADGCSCCCECGSCCDGRGDGCCECNCCDCGS
jgi:hypothetical protein